MDISETKTEESEYSEDSSRSTSHSAIEIENLPNEVANSLVSDSPRALLEMQRFVHTLAGCPEDLLPRSVDDAKMLALRCSLGIWYTQIEPKLKIPKGAAKFIRNVARALVANNVIIDDVIMEMVAFISRAATWLLDSGRAAAVYFGVQITTGLGDLAVTEFGRRDRRCKLVIEQIVDRCFLENIGKNKSAQIRDAPIRNMIFDEVEFWFKSRPEFYFGPCSRVLALVIKHPKAYISLAGIQILTDVLLKEASDDRVIVDSAFMWDIKDDLSKRVLKPDRTNEVDPMVKTAIHHFVTTRYPNSNPSHDGGHKEDEWREFVRLMFED